MKVLLLFVIFLFNKGFHASKEWFCDDGTPIQAEWKCDNSVDCDDRSDESFSNCPHRKCRFEEFECDSGACIERTSQCDSVADCSYFEAGDWSDEIRDCIEIPPEITNDTCDFNKEFLCENGECIMLDWVCDDADDCGDNSDEPPSCEEPCPIHHIKCNTSDECIEKKWLCDGEKDCAGGEDENYCSTPVPTRKQMCEIEKFSCGGNCLPVVKACDEKVDCPGGEDEGAHCSLDECHLRSDPLDWSGKDKLCDQLCRQTPQGPKCTCILGYKLEPDGYRCKPLGSMLPKLFFVADREIRAILLHAVNIYERREYLDYKTPDLVISAVDFDGQSNTIYWVEKQSNTVMAMDVPMHPRPLFEPLEMHEITAISLDWITKNLYVSYISLVGDSGKIGVLGMDKRSYSRSFFTLDLDLSIPISIMVYPKIGKIFAVDRGNFESQLISADMDGKNKRVLHTERQRLMLSVAIDYVTDILYWSEMNRNEALIKMMKIDNGSSKKTLISSNQHDFPLKSPVALAVFEDRLYFCDNHSREIWAVDSVTGKPSKYVDSIPQPLVKDASVSNLVALRVYHPIMQNDTKVSPCFDTDCSHMCVQRPGGRSCICPQHMRLISKVKCAYKSTPPPPLTLTSKVNPSAAASSQPIKTILTTIKPSTTTSTERKLTTTAPKTIKVTTTSTTTQETTTSTTPKETTTSTTPKETTTSTTPKETTTSTTQKKTTTSTTPTSKILALTTTTTTTSAIALPSSKTALVSSPTDLSATASTLNFSNSFSEVIHTLSTIDDFSKTAPIIKNIHCLKPRKFVGGSIKGKWNQKYPVGSKAVISCFPGWHIPDNSKQTKLTIVCAELGKWNLTARNCIRHTCYTLNCGKCGKCIKKKKLGAVCKCMDGKVSFTWSGCISSCEQSTTPVAKDQKSQAGLIVGCILASLVIILIVAFAIRSFMSRKPEVRYSLVEEEETSFSTKCKSDDNANINALSKQDVNGFNNPNYTPTKTNLRRLPLPENFDTGANQSGCSSSSAESPGVYNYKFLKESEESDLYENLEQVDECEVPLRSKTLNRQLAGVRNTITNAFSLRKSASSENILPRQ